MKTHKLEIYLQHLTKKYKHHLAVKDFSLTINQGDCIGLIGPNGAGKTTLLNMLAGILKADDGLVTINGQPIKKQRHLIGYLPQYPNFYDWMTAEEVLTFYSKLFGMNVTTIKQRIPEVLTLVGLSGYEKHKVASFSGGMKQRLGIAQAVIHKPLFVILDEPVSSLDPIGRREILDLIEQIKDQTTLIFSTHILGDAQEVCNRFCILVEGEKRVDFYLNDLQEKHTKNSLSITLKETNSDWLSYLESLTIFEKISVNNHSIYLESSLPEKDWLDLILKSISDYHIQFSKISLDTFSLEDYFMTLVGEKNE